MSSIEEIYSIFKPKTLSDISDVDRTIACSELMMYASEWYLDELFNDPGPCETKKETYEKLCEAAQAIVTETDQSKLGEKFNYVDYIWEDLMAAKDNLQKKLDTITIDEYDLSFHDDDIVEDEEF